MEDFTQGGEWLLKNVTTFFYGETNISLKINIDGKQPTCRYQLDALDKFNKWKLKKEKIMKTSADP